MKIFYYVEEKNLLLGGVFFEGILYNILKYKHSYVRKMLAAVDNYVIVHTDVRLEWLKNKGTGGYAIKKERMYVF